MITPTKLIKIARKWQKAAGLKRKRISLPRSSNSMSSVADKGHFFVYTADQRRFSLPIMFLNNQILRELLRMSEEEFGLQSNGPIRLPCDAIFMEYMISLIKLPVDEDIEKALLMSIVSGRCSLAYSVQQVKPSQQLLVCSC